MNKTFVTLLATGAVLLAGCTQTTVDKQMIGTGAGAVLGGLAGSKLGKGSGQLWAVGAGTLLGALVGSSIGESLDKADRMYADQANERAQNAQIGETIEWSNPESGNRGTITPVREGHSTAGRYCREYQQTIYVGGRQESGYGQACRQPDGSWEVVN